jgi:hypothetical protein
MNSPSEKVAYLAAEVIVLVIAAVNRVGLFYGLHLFTVARGTGITLGFHVRDRGALALAGEHGGRIEDGEPLRALADAHGWRSLGAGRGCGGVIAVWCWSKEPRPLDVNL